MAAKTPDTLTIAIISTTVSVAVSTITTLAIELLAKPRLETRKERILAAHRTRRTLQASMFTIAAAAAHLNRDQLPPDMTEELRRAWRAEEGRAFAQIDATTTQLTDSLVDAAGTYRWRILDLVVQYVAITRAVTISSGPERRRRRSCLSAPDPYWTSCLGRGGTRSAVLADS